MDFSYSEEQKMLAEAIRRYAEKEYAPRSTSPENEYMQTAQRRIRWRALADMGMLGLLMDTTYGGLEKNITDATVVMHEFGRGLLNEPYASSGLAAASILQQAANTQQKERWLSTLIDGSEIYAVAVESPDNTHIPTDVEVRNGALYGTKVAVLAGDLADWLLIPAYCGESKIQRLYCVHTSAVGLFRDTYPNIDGQTSTDVILNGVPVQESDELQAIKNINACVEYALDIGRTALCAEAWGLLERVFEQTIEYLKTRKQFGSPLASFQIMQHRCVDMLVSVEQAQSAALMAAAGILSDSLDTRRKMVSAAKAQIGRYIRNLTEQTIQSVGGIGMTQEFPSTRYILRLHAINMTWGNTDFHTDRYGEAFK